MWPSRTSQSGPAPPRYHNDPEAPRYLLPGEERARDIVGELISTRAWTFEEWSAALPETAVAFVAAARAAARARSLPKREC